MKKIISTCIALMVSAACSISAFAMEVPTSLTHFLILLHNRPNSPERPSFAFFE